MEIIDEVLASQKRIRLVLAARATPKAELLAAAAVQGVDNGHQVLYIGPSNHGLLYDKYVVFPPNWSRENEYKGIWFMDMGWFDTNLSFGTYGKEFVDGTMQDMHPDLIIMRDPYLYRADAGLVWNTIFALAARNHARILIATLPMTEVGKPLSYNRIYRLWRQSQVFDDIDVWHWPSPPNYVALFGHYFPPPMFEQELKARWIEGG